MFDSVRDRVTRFDKGFLVVVAVCLLAIWPFISRSGLPQATDAELHIFRLAELSRLFRAGEFFPRWAPNFYYGYGYPIFNYYAPLVYYFGLLFELLPVISPVDAVKILFLLGLLVAGIGMYGFVREIWGRVAGVVAAAAYVYAPYLLYIDPHARGDLAEAFSFALLPLGFWAMERLRRRLSSWNWLASSLILSAIIMTHNLMAMVFFGLIMIWVIWQELSHNVPDIVSGSKKQIRYLTRYRLVLALLMGVGGAASFWLVVALEQNAVNLSSLIGDGGHFDYRNHFLTLQELLTGSRLIDWGAAGPAYNLNIGIAQWLMAAAGVAAIVKGISRARIQAAFFLIGAFLLIFLMLPVSTLIWKTLPLLPFLQFPWRLLGPLAAFVAVLAGIGAGSLFDVAKNNFRVWIPAIAVGLILILALPLIQVQPWPADFGPTTAGRVLSEELAARWLGTTSTADFVPATIDAIPGPQESLLLPILQNRPADRVNRVTLPAGTVVGFQEETPLHFKYQVSSEQDFLLRLFLFDFPGWQTRIDGEAVSSELGMPEGFIVIPVPAGDHLVDVEFTSTTARDMATVVSLIALGLMIVLAWAFRGKPPSQPDPERQPPPASLPATFKVLWPTALIALLIFAVNVVFIEPTDLLHYDYDGTLVQAAGYQASVNFGDQIELIGYDLPAKAIKPGEKINFTAYWQLINEPVANYQVFVHISDETGVPVAQSDKLNPGDIPARRWPDDKYIIDTHTVQLPQGLGSGAYSVSIGLWVANEGWRLPVRDLAGNDINDVYILPERLVVK